MEKIEFMLVDLNKLREVLLIILTKARENLNLKLKATVRDKQMAVVQVVGTLIGTLSKIQSEDTAMDTLELGMKGLVEIGELKKKSSGQWDIRILELVEEVEKTAKPGQGKPITDKKNVGNTFYNRVWTLKKEGRIPAHIKPMQRKGTYYLYKEAKEK